MIRGARFVDWQEPEPFAEVERRMVELKRARNEPADNCEGQDDSDEDTPTHCAWCGVQTSDGPDGNDLCNRCIDSQHAQEH